MTRPIRSILLALGLAFGPGLVASPALAGCNLWLQFEFGSATLGAEPQALLDKVAALYPDASYSVEAHADAPGSEFQNLVISRARAEAVADHLAARGVTGVSALTARAQTQLIEVVHGPLRLNRRAEIYVSPCSEAALLGS